MKLTTHDVQTEPEMFNSDQKDYKIIQLFKKWLNSIEIQDFTQVPNIVKQSYFIFQNDCFHTL